MSLCENNCNFIGYENNTKEAQCECSIKSKLNSISEIINQTNLLFYDNFKDKNLTTNMITMKCYNTLFTKDGLLSNIGNYLILFTILLFSISGILVYKCGYNILLMSINEILSLKERKRINHNPNKKIKIKTIKKQKDKKCDKLKIKYNNTKQSNKGNNIISYSKIDIKSQNVLIYPQKRKRKLLKKKFFNDYELNFLFFKYALNYDKRTLLQYYISLLISKQPLIFSFYPYNDYNIIIVKIDLFFLTFSIHYFINALFFNESAIHKIYEEEGIYNIGYFFPSILYSFIISHILYISIKYLFLSERNISQINKENNEEKAKEISEKVKKVLVIKYIFFYVLSFIFLIFLWYYLSSFSAVYKNTQIFLIKNCLICFFISLLFPFFINVFPSIFRNYSLKKRKECIYKFSIVLQYI